MLRRKDYGNKGNWNKFQQQIKINKEYKHEFVLYNKKFGYKIIFNSKK